MADSDEQQVSSTTPMFNEEVHHYQAEPEPELEPDLQPEPQPESEPRQDLFSLDDIVDLVGGAQDALQRHIAEDSAPHDSRQTSAEEPETIPEPAHIPEPEPEPEPTPVLEQKPVLVPEPEPEAKPVVVPKPEPEAKPVVVPKPEPEAKPVVVIEPEPEPLTIVKAPEPKPEPVVDSPVPDSTTSSFVPEEPKVVAPKAEPEVTKIASQLNAAPAAEPEPAPQSDALPAAEPQKAAPAVAEAAVQPAVTQEPAAPASLVDLLYWRDVKTTGVVFGASLLLLLSLTMCSIVSVCSYIGLALLSVTICFRIYKGILQAIQKSDEGHPFKQYLDQEVALSEDLVHKYSDMILAKLNKTIGDLRRVFLVEDLVDSIKFAVLMWILTYVGALFNGLTLLILGLVGVFSCPIIYEKHQAQIDHYLALVNSQIKDVVGKIQAKVPGMKRKTE
ncbi:reticulon-4a isoform X4 [Melanotaenia boesemani]|uniref:reticulon-4a isoform X4 n=1 Tax=Melanotaenia boesemani TaxID=1250792 RepID=UPI001C046758|nr:reticulon-4a isoform X4 [Melanotaenia boesemani]